MALSKRITLSNGVAVFYHRITAVSTYTNVQNTIQVSSYTSKKKREEEEEAIKTSNWENVDVFVHGSIFDLPYDEEMTVTDAYNWLKENVPEFEGATDV